MKENFFSVEWSTIKNYTSPTDRKGKPNEYRKELIDAGLLSLTNAECKNWEQNVVGDDSISCCFNFDKKKK